jgi:nucleotide-binding universal stress UspA family protein
VTRGVTRNYEQEAQMKILVGYDGSDLAKRALNLAQDHAKAFGAEVIHVLHSKVTDLPEKQHKLDEQDMDDLRSSVEKEGLLCETHLLIRNMEPGPHLVQFAEEHGIDEIVVGVKMRSKVGKLLMGSTAQHVILQAPCPVVSVK